MEIIDFSARRLVAASVRCKAYPFDTSWRDGEKVCRRRQENGYLKMDIGPFRRLLSKGGGHSGLLMSYQHDNREIRK
jgi:hypothetical protein